MHPSSGMTVLTSESGSCLGRTSLQLFERKTVA